MIFAGAVGHKVWADGDDDIGDDEELMNHPKIKKRMKHFDDRYNPQRKPTTEQIAPRPDDSADAGGELVDGRAKQMRVTGAKATLTPPGGPLRPGLGRL